MLIDWFTVGAQALNFLILVWLMKRFLYKPIVSAIDAREKLIAAELADAAAKKAEAHKEQAEFQSKNAAFDQQRAGLMTKATDDAKIESQRLQEDARKTADILQAKRMEALATDAATLNQSIRRRTEEEVFAIARKTLVDLAGASLEGQMCGVFVDRLRAIQGPAKDDLGKALKTDAAPAVVRSTFNLPPEQRAAIQKGLNETFSADIHLSFETTPDLVSGIELSAAGQKIEWSIAAYLTAIQGDVSQLFKNQPKLTPQPKDSEHAA